MKQNDGSYSTSPAIRRLLFNEGGQAVVEFALVMPILMLIVIGIFEFGRAWNTQQAITDAAREGVRKAVIFNPNTTTDSVKNAVNGVLTSVNLDPSKATLTIPACITASGRTCNQNEQSTLELAYPYEFLFLGRMLSWATDKSNLMLRTRVTMRNE